MTNARFEDLEKRVKTIKLKKYTKITIVLLLFCVFGYYGFIILESKKVAKPLHMESAVKQKVPKAAHVVKAFEPIVPVKPIIKKVAVKEEKVKYDTIKLSPHIKMPEKINIQKEIKVEKKEEKLELIKRKKITLHVKEVKSEKALLERFKVAGDFDSAIALAHLYFEKKSFEKSIYWSKKASKLNSGDDLAWIVYAKSKSALGENNDAIKALQLYLEYFSSDEIQKLLKTYGDKK